MSKNKRPAVSEILANPFPWEPIEDRVIIYPDEQPTVTDKGLYIPQSALGKPTTGHAVAVGNGIPGKVEMKIERGDHIMYGRYAGTEIEVEDTIYIVVRQSDIMLVDRKSKLDATQE